MIVECKYVAAVPRLYFSFNRMVVYNMAYILFSPVFSFNHGQRQLFATKSLYVTIGSLRFFSLVIQK
jgi:hypothetical protein